jgi:biofilm PGA synthesis N-glycosyltransferase PgaC
MKLGIIIPTLNERHNISPLVRKIKDFYPQGNIIIVDDNSKDGTGKIAEKLAQKYKDIYVVHRKVREGIGAALVDGFKFALEQSFDPIITMDGDQSHDPKYLKNMVREMKDHDLVICSRYISGVRVDGWRFRKLLISKLANMFVAYLLVKPIWDFTTGYRAYSARFLSQIDMDLVPPQGYLIQIHMIHLAYSLKFRVKEIPFLYKDNEYNVSKLSPKERRTTFYKSFNYRAPFLEILRHLTYVKRDYHRFVEEYEQLLNPPPLKKLKIKAKPGKLNIDVGLMAYNEEKNIERCLNALLSQNLESGIIRKIIVVSSGSTDNTNKIVADFETKYPQVQLILQARREGKASAINEFIAQSKSDICVLESADTFTMPDTIEKLIKPFRDIKIGMSGAHPIPINSQKGFIGFVVHKLWRLHHLMALDNPKCGELIAFRNVLTKIPEYTAVDEAVIESLIRESGYELLYISDAIVKNKGPETVRDFIKQRVRIAAGHKHLSSTKGYKVSTLKPKKILPYILKDLKWNPKEIAFTICLILLEGFARIIGTLNFYLRDKNPYIWDISFTTKNIEHNSHQI